MNPPKYFYFRVKTDIDGITLEDASDVDVVEVVRCKDCIYWQKPQFMGENDFSQKGTGGRRMAEYRELIDKYRITQHGNSDYNPPSYEWVDNTGEIVRCENCVYAPIGDKDGADLEWPDSWANKCPFKCEDCYYSKKPDPDFFCANGIRRQNDGSK